MIKTTIEKHWHGREVKIAGRQVVGKSAYEIGLVTEGQAKLLCAKRYGYLAASITTQAFGGKGTDPEDPHKYSRMVRTNLLANTAEYARPKKEYSSFDMTIQSPKEEFEVFVGTPVEYGPYVEFGTVKMSAQPFLRPALALAKGEALTIVRINGKMHFKSYLTERDQFRYRNEG